MNSASASKLQVLFSKGYHSTLLTFLTWNRGGLAGASTSILLLPLAAAATGAAAVDASAIADH